MRQQIDGHAPKGVRRIELSEEQIAEVDALIVRIRDDDDVQQVFSSLPE